jgi:hypothetical protein
MPTTLVAHAEVVRNAWQSRQTNAQETLVTAQSSLTSAREDLADRTRQLADTEKAIAARNAALPAAETPADQDVLVAEIAALRAVSRALQAAILDASEDAERAQAEADVATAALRRAADGLKATLATLAAAVKDRERFTRWQTELGRAPLQTLPDDAGAALTGELHARASTRVSELPTELRNAARRSYEVENARIEAFAAAAALPEDLLAEEEQDEGGALGFVFQRQVILRREQEALRAWVERGRERYDRALSLLRDLAGTEPPLPEPPHPLLNQDQRDRLEVLTAAGEAAAEARVTREERREAVNEAQANLDDARIRALAPDPAADVSGVQEVQDAQAALDTALEELVTAQAAYAAVEGDFVAWAAAVPDSVWRKVVGFFEAEAILQQLSNQTPADLVDAVETAEEQLVGALELAERSATTLAFLADQLALRRERRADARAARQMRLLSATRGDA